MQSFLIIMASHEIEKSINYQFTFNLVVIVNLMIIYSLIEAVHLS
jgi:hypothetical protein